MAHPDFPSSDPDDDDGGTPERPPVFVSTAIPIPIGVGAIDDVRAPGGSVLGTYIGDRLVARCAMPREAIEQLLALKLFDEPVPLALLAVEDEPGVQARLFALVPASRLMDLSDEGEDEPWRASIPSFEEAAALGADDDDDVDADDDDDDEEDAKIASILLGHIVRFERDRMHAGDLAAEAVDILQKIVTGGVLHDADSKAVDDLLDSL